MNRSETLAHNAGVRGAIAFTSALAEDISAKLADAPERYAAAVAALEVVIEAAPQLMLPVPGDADVAGELAAIIESRRGGAL